MKTYELTYVVSDAVNDDSVADVMSEITKQIEDLGGTILKEEPWGKRRLTYPINHRNMGSYVTVQMHLEGEKVKELERAIKLNNQILRHLVVSLIPQAIKTTDEAELAEALEKRVEEKITGEEAPKIEEKPEVVEETKAETPEVKKEEATPEPEAKPKKTTRAKISSTDEKKEVEDEERKKLVDQKLSELLGEDKES